MIAERKLYAAIRSGLGRYTATPAYFAKLLERLNLEPEEAADAMKYFAGGTAADGSVILATPPTLVPGYARPGGPIPAWAFTLVGEQEVQSYLGDDDDALDESDEGEPIPFVDPITGESVDGKTRRVRYTFAVMVLTEHPDVTVYYYQLLKAIVLGAKTALINEGLDDLEFNGADLAPDAKYLPSTLWARIANISVTANEYWLNFLDEQPATRLSGLANDDTGNGETFGDGSVAAGITPKP